MSYRTFKEAKQAVANGKHQEGDDVTINPNITNGKSTSLGQDPHVEVYVVKIGEDGKKELVLENIINSAGGAKRRSHTKSKKTTKSKKALKKMKSKSKKNIKKRSSKRVKRSRTHKRK